MTQQVRAVTRSFRSPHSGSHPVATANAHARVGLTPEPVREHRGVATAAGTTHGRRSRGKPAQVLADHQLSTPTKKPWPTLRSAKLCSLERS